MIRRYICLATLIILLVITSASNLWAKDYSDRNLVGLDFYYTFSFTDEPGMFGSSMQFYPMDFIIGVAGNVQTDFKTVFEAGLGLERPVFIYPSPGSNARAAHISLGAQGTYNTVKSFGYDVYLRAGFAILPTTGLGLTLLFNHEDLFSLRVEYSGAAFLEKIFKEDLK